MGDPAVGGGGERDDLGRFRKGFSGNPAGRPKGSFRAGSRAAARLLDAHAEALVDKAIEMALAGDPVAVRFCLGRILGARRSQPVEFPLPEMNFREDLAGAMSAVVAAVAEGTLAPDEATAVAHILEELADRLHSNRPPPWTAEDLANKDEDADDYAAADGDAAGR